MHSYLNYANIARGSTQKTKLSTLYRPQKHAIRLLSFKDQFTHSRPFFKEIGALNIYEINIFNILCLMFKCKNKACPKAFENLSTLKTKTKYQLKRSCTVLESFCKTKFSQLCINYCGPHLWNTIWHSWAMITLWGFFLNIFFIVKFFYFFLKVFKRRRMFTGGFTEL